MKFARSYFQIFLTADLTGYDTYKFRVEVEVDFLALLG